MFMIPYRNSSPLQWLVTVLRYPERTIGALDPGRLYAIQADLGWNASCSAFGYPATEENRIQGKL